MRQQFRVREFTRDVRGTTAIFFALAAIPIMGVASLSVDYGIALKARTHMQTVADIAAIDGAKSSNSTDEARKAAAVASLKVNAAGGSSFTVATAQDGTVTVTGAGSHPSTFTVTSVDGLVTVSATGSSATSIANAIGVRQLNFGVESQAKADQTPSKQLELSMMIDLTGSMGAYRNGVTKISALKTAADDMLNILFPDGASSSEAVRVAIAPFSDYVNAGGYVGEVTGLPSTGPFTNLDNLGSTRQGRATHVRYTGATGNQSGSQAGATSPTGVANASGASTPTSTASAGGTFSNDHCVVPTTTTTTYSAGNTVNIKKYRSVRTGAYVPVEGTNTTIPFPLRVATYSNPVYYIERNKTGNGASFDYSDNAWAGIAYVPMYVPASFAQMSIVQRTDGGNTGDVGVRIAFDEDATLPPELKEASPSSGYWRIRKYKDDAFEYEWTTSGRYLPVWGQASTVTSATPGCETEQQQASSRLISCVTERTGAQAYTDAGPGTAVVQPYNHGNAAISNYSSDGKCWVSGRELPSIIPLTNQKQTLTEFFANARVGGATPGHLGTAWAWYLLSPSWSTVFTGPAAPKPYDTQNLMKVAVLMTDGEYNIHYASPSAREQALQLCANMKAAGVTIYTVGFGFSTNATPSPTGTAEQRAKDLLIQCASPGNKYFFPYDGDQLRQDFQNIGSQLMGELQATTSTSARLRN